MLGQNDREMRQYWGLIQSEQAKKRETITLNKRIEKAEVTARKKARNRALKIIAAKRGSLAAPVIQRSGGYY